MDVANNLCISTCHADVESLAESLEPGQNDWFGEDVQHERQQVESGTDVGVIGQGVPCTGVRLCESFEQLSKPWNLYVNVCNSYTVEN